MAHLPEDWLFVTLTDIKEAQTRHAAEMRKEFQEIRTLHQQHAVDDTKIQGSLDARLKAVENKQSETSEMRRHLQTLLLSAGLVAIWDGIKHLTGWR